MQDIDIINTSAKASIRFIRIGVAILGFHNCCFTISSTTNNGRLRELYKVIGLFSERQIPN